MWIEQSDSFGNDYSDSINHAVKGDHVKHLNIECLILTWPHFTAIIEANRFQNCPIAQSSLSDVHVPLFNAPPGIVTLTQHAPGLRLYYITSRPRSRI